MDATGVAAIVVTLITGAVTIYTQRGAPRARRQTAELEARAADIAAFTALRDAALADATRMREEASELRVEIHQARTEILAIREARDADLRVMHALTTTLISTRALVPDPPGPPAVPAELADLGIT